MKDVKMGLTKVEMTVYKMVELMVEKMVVLMVVPKVV